MKVSVISNKIFNFFASFYLSCFLFLMLFILTVLGTIDQVNLGLYDTQKKYFDSLYLFYEINFEGFTLPIPLPGVYLVLIFLFINTIVGTIKHIPFRKEKIGIYIIHFSMILLFTGSFITFKMADDGQMTLEEGQSTNRFYSYHDWQLSIIDTSNETTDTVYSFDINFDDQIINQSFSASPLPFTITIKDFARNARVLPKGPMFDTKEQIINGFFIAREELSKTNEQNIPAIIVTVSDKSQSTEETHIVSGYSEIKKSLQISVQNKMYIIRLHKKSWDIPFLITLDKVERDLYPGTMQAKAYRSYIRKIENNIEEKKEVYMNHPYRYQGYIFFQSGFTDDPNTNTKLSTFAVMKNPTDHVPLISCILISVGLLVHFLTMLSDFLKRESRL